MGLSLALGPTTEPVSLSEVKANSRIDISDDDGLLAGKVLAARRFVEGEICRPIVSRMFDYTADYCWPTRDCQHWIELPYPPLQAVRSVSYVDSAGTTQVLATSQYQVLSNRPKGAIVPPYAVTWPTLRSVPQAVTVRFIAGYTNFTDTLSSPNFTVSGPGVPDELREAIMVLVDGSYDGKPIEDLMPTVEALISGFRA